MVEQALVPLLLVKIAVAAALASILARWRPFLRMLMQEERTLPQRMQFAMSLAAVYGAGVTIRVVTGSYTAADLGLEGSFLAGVCGGYAAGLAAGIVISLPAMLPPGNEWLSMLLFAAVGLTGGLLRDCAPDREEVWRFSPDLSLWRLFRQWRGHRRTAFQIIFLLTIICAEFLRALLASIEDAFGRTMMFALHPAARPESIWRLVLVYAATVFCVTVTLKIWNAARNERKLEAQQRLLAEARLAALTRQINPHFLFNTLNSVATLIRLNPSEARAVIYKLSNILRRLLRKEGGQVPLRDELAFVDDYLAIEMVRFGPKLRFEKEVDPLTLDMPVPSMLLQPLVENSIKHGLSSKVEGGIIRVSSRLEGSRLMLVVEDDGVGIPEEKLSRLFEQGIGVSNVNERLKVLFGSDYRMWIDSKPGEGTRTGIEIPELSARLAAVS